MVTLPQKKKDLTTIVAAGSSSGLAVRSSTQIIPHEAIPIFQFTATNGETIDRDDGGKNPQIAFLPSSLFGNDRLTMIIVVIRNYAVTMHYLLPSHGGVFRKMYTFFNQFASSCS